jgi:hypothetical protein
VLLRFSNSELAGNAVIFLFSTNSDAILYNIMEGIDLIITTPVWQCLSFMV